MPDFSPKQVFLCVIYSSYSKPLSLKEMQAEEEQIMNIKGLAVGNIGFISVRGFEEVSSEYDCISGEELY